MKENKKSSRFLYCKTILKKEMIIVNYFEKFFRKATVVVMLVLCAYICSMSLYAQKDYSDTYQISCQISFDSKMISVGVTIKGNEYIDSIEDCSITVTDGSNCFNKSWTGLRAEGSTLSVTKIASGITKGETYTVTIIATVHRGKSTEKISESFTRKYE